MEKEKPGYITDTLTNILDQLDQLANFQKHSCLQIIYNSTTFFIHINEGQLIYATSSLAPFERLERHLRRLSNQNPQINSIIKRPRTQFKNDLQSYAQVPSDYKAILWLSEQNYLTEEETSTLIRRVTREVFESILCLPDQQYQHNLVSKSEPIQELYRFDLKSYLVQCRKRLDAWNAFADKIWSTYQRPYLVTEKTTAIGDLTAQQNQAICKLLKGLNFRQISAILDLDELVIAKLLYPSILDGEIVVRDPKTPFDNLPRLPQRDPNQQITESSWQIDDADNSFGNDRETIVTPQKKWKVAYVDDDFSLHHSFLQHLDRQLFLTVTIQDSMDAFSQLIEFNPDLILLDADMPNLNGYELCALLRNHSSFKKLPIIILDTKTASISSPKFRAAKATNLLSKPYDRIQLLSIIQQYLN